MKFFAVEDEGSNRRAVRGRMEDNDCVDIGRRAEVSSAVVASPRVITEPHPHPYADPVFGVTVRVSATSADLDVTAP
jgi:hypothetical protein